MFKTRRKSFFKTSRRSSYRPYRKQRPPLKRWQIAAALPVALVALELIARIGVGLIGTTPDLKAYRGNRAADSAYALSYHSQDGTPYTAIPDQGSLQVTNHPLKGYALVADQTSDLWNINAQGFRAAAALSETKAPNEMRIFILGGSAAFGQGSSNNEATFASQLQTLLNQQVADQQANPGNYRPAVLPYFADEQAKALQKPAPIQNKQYRVVNAAVPGYASGNELAHLVDSVLIYGPDLILLVNGYGDLLLPSDRPASSIPELDRLLSSATVHLGATTQQRIGNTFNRSVFLRSLRYWLLRPQDKAELTIPPGFTQADIQLPQDTAELEKRTQRYRQNLQKIATVTSAANIPLIVAIQPELTSRINRSITPSEQAVLDKLGQQYPDRIDQAYQQLRAGVDQVKTEFPGKVLPLTLEDLYFEMEAKAFYDPIHLTDEANKKLAEKLYGAIASRLSVESKPYSARAPL